MLTLAHGVVMMVVAMEAVEETSEAAFGDIAIQAVMLLWGLIGAL